MCARLANEGSPADVQHGEALRIDLWLWYARFFRSRTLASEAVQGGKVHVNSQRVKAAHRLRIGDQIALGSGSLERVFEVLSLPSRRGPAPEASRSYRESDASMARRAAQQAEQRLIKASAPRTDARPSKHERRALRRLRGRDA